MINTILGVLIITCIICAMFFAYKWFELYGKQKEVSVFKMLKEGKYKPKYLKNAESPFSTELTNRLNGIVILIYSSMFLGVVLVMILQILKK